MSKVWIVLVAVVGIGYFLYWSSVEVLDPRGVEGEVMNTELEKYDFDSLRSRYKSGEFRKVDFEILGEVGAVELRRSAVAKAMADESEILTRQIRYKSGGKWIMGMMNVPEGILRQAQDDPSASSGQAGVIIMIRGYADKGGYHSGFGSWRVADELAKAGFVTVSLDFLGYGGSDSESLDMMEARFEKVVGVLDLIEAVKKLNFVDKERIGIWAHSNGGQIAMSVLEITGANYPTVLWAPMTNPFPKSILDTASELSDGGKAVVLALREFKKKYDVRRYAIENYYHWINAPIVIHQGSVDVWCKVEWQENLESKLRELGKDVELKVYNGDDHNLSRNWGGVVEFDVRFFKEKFRIF